MSFAAVILAGLAAGAQHVLTGPDHLAALAPLAVDAHRRGAWTTGLAWGLGHALGAWALALAAWLLRDALPLERLGAASEWLVGVLLILIGLWGLRRLLAVRVHAHVHTHDGVEHAHIHVHDAPITADHARAAHAHTHSAVGIGTLHGVAGGAHLVGVLPALGLPSSAAAVAYLACYGIGSIGAMSAFSWSVGRVAREAGDRAQRAYRWLAGGSCTAALGIGLWWLIAGA